MARLTLTFMTRVPYNSSDQRCENPHDRAGAVFRAPGHSVQRIPPHPRAASSWVTRSISSRIRSAATSSLPGLRVFRCLRPPFIHDVRIGPSFAKIPLDLALTVHGVRRALSDRYDAVHSHEEGSFIGVVLAGMLGVPHLYDMHSSLPQQLTNFAFSRSRVADADCSRWMERFVIRRSRVVIVICPHLEETVREHRYRRAGRADRERARVGRCAGRRARAPRFGRSSGSSATRRWCSTPARSRRYQGLDLLFAAARR